MKEVVKKFKQFEAINEDDKSQSTPLRGYSAESVIDRIEELMEVMPDKMKFGVPSDNKGYALTYRDANGAIQKIQDIERYYAGKGEDSKFYCWNVSYAGSWDATKSLKSKISEFGGFGKDVNMNLKKIISYFSENPEDADNVRSISISIDTYSIRKDAASNVGLEDPYPQPTGKEAPSAKEETEDTETED